MNNRPIRIANCSGFYGDRMDAMREQVEGGDIDVITGDYLAEVTMLILAKAKLKDPDLGYARTFLRQLEPLLEAIADRGIKVVVNAGGLSPGVLAQLTRSTVEKHGLGLAVAHVEGDDLIEQLLALQGDGHEFRHLDTGAPLSTWGLSPVCANAYLGGFGIARALSIGADIVITGRVADASVVAGAAAWWWGWDETNYDALAGAVAAGHIIECGAQATGGNFSGFQTVPGLERPGFPIVEIDQDGSSVIKKHAGTGGCITTDTVTAQLVYEIGHPWYLNPDVTTHLDTLQLDQVGDDEVRVSGNQGSAPSPTTKVSICAIDGWRNTASYVLTGRDISAKTALVERTVRAALEGAEGVDDLRFQVVGSPVEDSEDQFRGSCVLNISIAGTDAVAGRRFSSTLVEMALSSYPGLYSMGTPGGGSARGAYWPALLAADAVTQVVVHHDGQRDHVEAPATAPVEAPDRSSYQSKELDFGPSRRTALGDVAFARSGDKGGNANVGVWTTCDRSFEWLASTLDVSEFKALIPEASKLEVVRYVLPNLRALNFVVTGMLEGGAAGSLRFDSQAKALSEWLRSRSIEVPVEFVGSES